MATRRMTGATYDGGYFTPGAIADEMRAISGLVNSLNSDVQQSQVTPAFVESWTMFREEWAGFVRDNDDLFSRSLNQTFAKVLEYRDRVDDWRTKFVAEGGKLTAPGLPAFNKSRGSSFSWDTLIIGTGLVAAGYWFFVGRKKGSPSNE